MPHFHIKLFENEGDTTPTIVEMVAAHCILCAALKLVDSQQIGGQWRSRFMTLIAISETTLVAEEERLRRVEAGLKEETV